MFEHITASGTGTKTKGALALDTTYCAQADLLPKSPECMTCVNTPYHA